MENIKFKKGYVTIKVQEDKGKIGDKELPGYNFEYEGLSLTAHQDHRNMGTWCITENNTGLGLVMHKMSRKAAIIELKLFVKRIGSDRIKENIENQIGRK